MSKIISVSAVEIFDSRQNPTLAVTVKSEKGAGTFSVPSGASTGSHEAHELRDGNKQRFGGMGVLNAVTNVNTVIADALLGKSAADQNKIDRIMVALDGTPQKTRLGAN